MPRSISQAHADGFDAALMKFVKARTKVASPFTDALKMLGVGAVLGAIPGMTAGLMSPGRKADEWYDRPIRGLKGALGGAAAGAFVSAPVAAGEYLDATRALRRVALQPPFPVPPVQGGFRRAGGGPPPSTGLQEALETINPAAAARTPQAGPTPAAPAAPEADPRSRFSFLEVD